MQVSTSDHQLQQGWHWVEIDVFDTKRQMSLIFLNLNPLKFKTYN